MRVKVLRTTKGEGSGTPGTVLDDRLTIACGDGAVRILQLQRAGATGDDGRGIPARHAGRCRNARVMTGPVDGVSVVRPEWPKDVSSIRLLLREAFETVRSKLTLIERLRA